MHIMPIGCVAIRFKMLTYFVYAPLLNRIDALPLDIIYMLEITYANNENPINRKRQNNGKDPV